NSSPCPLRRTGQASRRRYRSSSPPRRGRTRSVGPHLFFSYDGALIGNGGWKPPLSGAAELGYAVPPARQGRGIATAVGRELVRRARAERSRWAGSRTASSGPSGGGGHIHLERR